jgi:hypothetical protein
MTSLLYKKESYMYEPVRDWWERFLKERYKRSQVSVSNTSRIVLYKFIQDHHLEAFFPDYLTYEVEVDVTGIMLTGDKAKLALVECKLAPIALRDVGQMLGYSKVVRPLYSLILSPRGLSDSLTRLLKSFQRFDVLDYGNGQRIRLATWSPQRQEVLSDSLLPPGEFF